MADHDLNVSREERRGRESEKETETGIRRRMLWNQCGKNIKDMKRTSCEYKRTWETYKRRRSDKEKSVKEIMYKEVN